MTYFDVERKESISARERQEQRRERVRYNILCGLVTVRMMTDEEREQYGCEIPRSSLTWKSDQATLRNTPERKGNH